MVINVEHEVLVVYPHTDYCNSLLHGVPAVHLSKLQHLQNSVGQLINHASRFCHISPMLHALHALATCEVLNLLQNCCDLFQGYSQSGASIFKQPDKY